jgi:hypothetical protein
MTVHPIASDNDHEGARTNMPHDPDESTPGPLDDIRSGIKAWFDVGVTIGDKVDGMGRKFDKFMARLQHNTPIDYGGAGSGVFPASGDLIIPLGTPDQGARWEVTNVVVGGTDLNVAAAGTAGLYVSAFQPTQNAPNPAGTSGACDYAKALPSVAFYGTRQLVVNDQEYLFLVVFGGTPGQTYVANFSTTVFNVDSAGGRDVNIL